jgi:hypothetical protein
MRQDDESRFSGVRAEGGLRASDDIDSFTNLVKNQNVSDQRILTIYRFMVKHNNDRICTIKAKGLILAHRKHLELSVERLL